MSVVIVGVYRNWNLLLGRERAPFSLPHSPTVIVCISVILLSPSCSTRGIDGMSHIGPRREEKRNGRKFKS
jgi:hypothetical protein